MDSSLLKSIIENIVKKILSDKDLLSSFKSDPASAVRQAVTGVDLKGADLDDQLVKAVVSSVKDNIANEIKGDDGKLDIGDIGNIIGKAKDIMGSRKED